MRAKPLYRDFLKRADSYICCFDPEMSWARLPAKTSIRFHNRRRRNSISKMAILQAMKGIRTPMFLIIENKYSTIRELRPPFYMTPFPNAPTVRASDDSKRLRSSPSNLSM